MRLPAPHAVAFAGLLLIGCSRPIPPRTVVLDGAQLTAGMTPADTFEILGRPDADTAVTLPGRRIGDGKDSVLIDAGLRVRELGYGPLARTDGSRYRLRLVFENDRLVEWDRATGEP